MKSLHSLSMIVVDPKQSILALENKVKQAEVRFFHHQALSFHIHTGIIHTGSMHFDIEWRQTVQYSRDFTLDWIVSGPPRLKSIPTALAPTAPLRPPCRAFTLRVSPSCKLRTVPYISRYGRPPSPPRTPTLSTAGIYCRSL